MAPRATLALELFADDAASPPSGIALVLGFRRPERPWVARIAGTNNRYWWDRVFLSYKKDYSMSNSIGSRGIFAWYMLDDGEVYEVNEQVTWRAWDRYFCRAENGRVVKMTEAEVLPWLKSRSE